MGDAKRRAKEIALLKEQEAVWRANLSGEESTIRELAERLDTRLVRGRRFSEGCYHLAFFMTRYLALQGIEVTPIIGWVNDGTWKGVASHAWIEYGGKKTDVSLSYTTHPDVVPTGGLIVHDYVLRAGKASYVYYKNDDPAALERLRWMRTVQEFRGVLAHKEREHRRMLEIASSPKLIEEYLASAPAGGRFEDLSALVT
jgi:hypothetical protein